jgi:hypothetical protein
MKINEATYHDKKPNSKTANGRRVPLTDLLGSAIPAANPPPIKKNNLAVKLTILTLSIIVALTRYDHHP